MKKLNNILLPISIAISAGIIAVVGFYAVYQASNLYSQQLKNQAIDECHRNSLSQTVEDDKQGTVRTWQQSNDTLYQACLEAKGI